ncbi:MAG: YggS family pyridoxal phosphate-dependent enzyme [Pyrinomonadaceae bacterium]
MSAEAGPDASGLRARAAQVLGRIAEAARRAGRDPREVTLVAVSKTHPAALVREAVAAGLRDFGENRVQEAEGKIAELKADLPDARWHLIGHLQPNKARRAARLFDLIHTVDSAALVQRLERICAEDARDSLDVLVQVDLAGEETKSGVTEKELPEVFEALKDCGRVRCRGLMTLPPFFDDAERVRPYFRRLRELRDEWRGRGAFGVAGGGGAGELSMGMSHDFEVAVEEGATLVRVGTSVFGERGGKV